MAKKQCRACGGVYHDVLRDGLAYYHACPPQILVTVERLGGTLELPLAQLLPADKEISRREVPRANARDERVKLSDDGTADGILSEGAGTVDLVDRP